MSTYLVVVTVVNCVWFRLGKWHRRFRFNLSKCTAERYAVLL